MNRKRNILITIIAVLVVILIVLLLKCCGNEDLPTPTTPPTTGDFEITDKPQETTLPSQEPIDVPSVTFVGRSNYYVSTEEPKIELRNSEKNEALGVTMVFTVIDAATDTVIARTPQVAPGQYVYINMMEYYTENGEYDILINISVTGANGEELNGMDQEAKLYVQNN